MINTNNNNNNNTNLISTPIPSMNINDFNKILDTTNQLLSCDSNCQQNQKLNELKKNYELKHQNLIYAKPQYELAQKQYYTLLYGGNNEYQSHMKKKWIDEATKEIKKFTNLYEHERSIIQNQLDIFNLLQNNHDQIHQYYLYLLQQIKNNKYYINSNINTIAVNDRQTYYENEKIDSLQSIIYTFLLTCYFITFFLLIYIIISSFNNQFIITYIIYLIICLLFPFIIPFILNYLIYLSSFVPHWI